MTITTDAATTVADALEQSSERVDSHLHPEGSFDVADHAVPTGREEVWRFTPLKRLRGLHDDAPLTPGLDAADFDVHTSGPAEISVGPVADPGALKGSSGYVPADRISARAWNASAGLVALDIPAEYEASEPVVFTITGKGTGRAAAAHAVLTAGAHSKATVVVRFRGSGTLADHLEIVLNDGAQLTVVSLQDWADDAVHVTNQHALIGRDATLRHIAVSIGGDVVRMNTSVEYAGPGGQAELLGLYFADAGQHLEHRLFVDHNAPRTKSNVVYKGALQGEGAHAVWIGNVLIRKVAEGIETYEENRNLVLTDGCRADSVPNLEIETGEIEGAGHASAIGRFDDEQLFYLRSRGIEESEARRLVVHGFFHDLIRKIGVPALEEELAGTVEAELAKNVLKAL